MKASCLKAVVTLLLVFAVSSAYATDAIFDSGRTLDTVVTALNVTVLVRNKASMDMYLLLLKQQDRRAIMELVTKEVRWGWIEIAPEFTTAYFIKGVNKELMVVRPLGRSTLYYAIRKDFDEGQPSSEVQTKWQEQGE